MCSAERAPCRAGEHRGVDTDLRSGTYIVPRLRLWGKPTVTEPHRKARDPATARLRWELSAELTGCDREGIPRQQDTPNTLECVPRTVAHSRCVKRSNGFGRARPGQRLRDCMIRPPPAIITALRTGLSMLATSPVQSGRATPTSRQVLLRYARKYSPSWLAEAGGGLEDTTQ